VLEFDRDVSLGRSVEFERCACRRIGPGEPDILN
jgi:hypothetical protein